jgi:hypothetical protein
MMITVNVLWIFTAGVLFVALIILYRSLNAESRVTLNVKEMTIHLTAFTLFLVASFIAMMGFLKDRGTPNSVWNRKCRRLNSD